MPQEISAKEYQKLVKGLDYLPPFHPCCKISPLEVLYIEPLNSRDVLETQRTCIIKCDECGKQYYSDWE